MIGSAEQSRCVLRVGWNSFTIGHSTGAWHPRREARCFADYETVVILFVILYKSYIVRLEKNT